MEEQKVWEGKEEEQGQVEAGDFSRRENGIEADGAEDRSAQIGDADAWWLSAEKTEERLAAIPLPSDHYKLRCVKRAWD